MADKIVGTEETPFTGLRLHDNLDGTYSIEVYDTSGGLGGGGGGGGAVTQATSPWVVSVATLPLPAGAATSAAQTTGNDSAATTATSSASVDSKTPAQGQAAMAQSSPVVIASNQSALPVSQSGTFTVQPGNTANTTAWKVDGSGVTQPVSVASVPLPTGAATESTLGGILTITDFDSKVGTLTETAPTVDTGSSGINGRLQRIAQRLSSLIALLPTALGANGGLKVEGVAGGVAQPASQSGTWTMQPGNTPNTTAWKVDGSAVTQPVNGTVTANLGTLNGAATAAKQAALGTAGTPSADVLSVQGSAAGTALPIASATGAMTDRSGTITAGGTAQTLAGSNATRKYFFIRNLSGGDLWFNYGIAAVASQPSIKLATGESYESDVFVSNQSISIIGASTSQAFVAKEA